MKENFENADLFLPWTGQTNCYANDAFRKRSSNWRNLKMSALRSSVHGKHFKTELFPLWRHDNHVISLSEFSSDTIQNGRWLLRLEIFPAKFEQESFDAFSECKRLNTPFSNLSGVMLKGTRGLSHTKWYHVKFHFRVSNQTVPESYYLISISNESVLASNPITS